MSEDISSKVKKIVADHLGIDEAKYINGETIHVNGGLYMAWQF